LTDYNSKTKRERSTKLGTHGERDPHALTMEGHAHFQYCTSSALALSLIVYSTCLVLPKKGTKHTANPS